VEHWAGPLEKGGGRWQRKPRGFKSHPGLVLGKLSRLPDGNEQIPCLCPTPNLPLAPPPLSPAVASLSNSRIRGLDGRTVGGQPDPCARKLAEEALVEVVVRK